MDLRYCLLSWDYHEEAEDNTHGNAAIPISGLFNWAKALGGARCFPRTPDEFEKFNIFHINLTTKNLFLLPTIKPKLPAGSKLVINVDFAIEMWAETFNYPELMLRELDGADMVFAVEPVMADMLAHALKRDVPCIPHPTDTDALKKLRQNTRTNQIAVNLHRYDMNFVLPYFAIRELPQCNFQTIATGSTASKSNLLHLYDFILEAKKFDLFTKELAVLYAALDTYTLHSYGRFQVDCACLGVPVAGPDTVASQRFLFNDLTFPVGNYNRARDIIHALIEDQNFHIENAKLGADLSEHYSLANSKERFVNALNNT